MITKEEASNLYDELKKVASITNDKENHEEFWTIHEEDISIVLFHGGIENWSREEKES